MRIILSPAKKMNVDTDSLAWRDLPDFLPQTGQLLAKLQSMSFGELKRLWNCNDQIAACNVERLQRMDLYRGLTPAIMSYEGIQYRYMAPGVFTDHAFAYIQEHLRILSGFYGILRPLDGVTPYRLEMQAKLPIGEWKDLYGFWSDRLARNLSAETDCILNLASKEYSRCISKYLPDKVRLLTCVFGQEQHGRIVEKGTLCKMARGEMVRYLAENQITDPEWIKTFDLLNYRYSQTLSKESTYVFVQEKRGT